MSKINTDKKLELIKTIRMQNNYDRQVFRMREGLLYSDTPEYRHRELYSLEDPEKSADLRKSKSFVNFRIRFVIALLLLLSFILCDVNHISFGKENADTFFERIKSSMDIEELMDRIK